MKQSTSLKIHFNLLQHNANEFRLLRHDSNTIVYEFIPFPTGWENINSNESVYLHLGTTIHCVLIFHNQASKWFLDRALHQGLYLNKFLDTIH